MAGNRKNSVRILFFEVNSGNFGIKLAKSASLALVFGLVAGTAADADIKVNTKYYLLTDKKISAPENVALKCLIDKNTFGNNWLLYEVEAVKLSEDAAKFFLNYHYRLTAEPVLIRPIYPIYTQDDEIIHCDSSKIFFYFSGNAKIRFFPYSKNVYSCKTGKFKIIEAEIDDHRQMIAVGRAQISKYLFVWKNLPSDEMTLSEIEVKDLNDKPVSSGVYNALPKDSILQVYSEFDYRIVISQDGIVKKKLFIKAGKIFDIADIKFGTEIKILQGLDCIFSANYKRKEKGISLNDDELFLQLKRGRGRKIKTPHTLGSFISKLKNYPKIQGWLYKSIRTGFVNEESYRLFRQFILKEM